MNFNFEKTINNLIKRNEGLKFFKKKYDKLFPQIKQIKFCPSRKISNCENCSIHCCIRAAKEK